MKSYDAVAGPNVSARRHCSVTFALLVYLASALPVVAWADWPTYMHDAARSGTTDEELELPLVELWRYEVRHPPAPAWPPPAKQDFWNYKTDLPARVTYDRAFHIVSDDVRVYFGSSADDQVRAVDLLTGKLLWTFFAEGPVRLAPTLDSGRIYFGADDGTVYCLLADSGELVWRRQPRVAGRRIPGNGRMISLWPIRTGVIVRDGQVRFASGLFPLQGTFQHVLAATDGKELAQGPLEFSPQGYLRIVQNRLVAPQGRAKSKLISEIAAGLGKENEAAAVPREGYSFSAIRAGSLRFAGGDGQLAAISEQDDVAWSYRVEGRVYSLAVAGGRLLASTDGGVVYCFGPPSAKGEADGSLVRSESTERDQSPPSPDVVRIVAQVADAGIDRGYALVVGDDGVADLAGSLAQNSQLRVVGAGRDASKLQGWREQLSHRGLYGQVALHTADGAHLPYASGLFNLIVVLLDRNPPTPLIAVDEVARLLVPGAGVALVERSEAVKSEEMREWARGLSPLQYTVFQNAGGLRIQRLDPDGVGQWTHMYAAPDNRACSDDRIVGSRLRLQWFGRPGPREMLDRHHRTVPPLFAAGRLYVPGNDRIFAVDAYNGSPLWDAEVADFRRVAAMRDSGSMAAARDYLYVVARDRCYGLDAKTGSFELNFSVPVESPSREWGYLAYSGDRLVGSTTHVGASRGDHSREQIHEAYFDAVPIVTSDSVFCLDRHSGELHWQYRVASGCILNPTITIAKGRTYFIENGDAASLAESRGRATLQTLLGPATQLVALDLTSGKVEWRKSVDLSAIEHHLYLCHADDKLIAVGSKNRNRGDASNVWYDLHAFSDADGERVWSATQNQRQAINGDHGEQDHHPVIVGGVVYQEPYAYDLQTGRRLDDWSFQRAGHGCGTVSASANTFFFRAGNPTMQDIRTGEHQKVTAVSRPGCWINMIPAGGLLLIPEASSGCTCDFPIQSSIALMSESLE